MSGRATDGKPHIGSSNAFSFNVPSVRAVGQINWALSGGEAQRTKMIRHLGSTLTGQHLAAFVGRS